VSEQEEDFATMFEASVKARRVEQGQTVEGTIVAIGAEVALVSIGGKSEAQIDVAELKDEDGDIEVSIGERLQARVISTKGGIILSRKGVRNAATHRELENAFEAGFAVGDHKTSTLQDLEAGRRLEIGCLSGAVVELADRLAIPVPTTRALHACTVLLDDLRLSRSTDA